jgi:phosphatidylglycerophosphate synthase
MDWTWRYIAYLVIGAGFSLAIMALAKPNRLFWLGQIPGFSPNWLSLWRIPLVALGFILFLNDYHFPGLMIVVFALTLDRIDGKMAMTFKGRLRSVPMQAQQEPLAPPRHLRLVKLPAGLNVPLYNGRLTGWHVFEREDLRGHRHRQDRRIFLDDWIFLHIGDQTWLPMFKLSPDLKVNPPSLRLTYTGIGEWLDPLVDKLNFLPIFTYLAYVGELRWWAVLPMIWVDLTSTVIRNPFLQLPVFRLLSPYLRESKAGPFGKIKYIFQFTSLLALMPSAAGWLPRSEQVNSAYIASLVLLFAVLAGSLGIFGRLTFFNTLLHRLALLKRYRSLRVWFEHGQAKRRKRQSQQIAKGSER